MTRLDSGSHPLFTPRRRTVGAKRMWDRPNPLFLMLCSGQQERPYHRMPSKAFHRVPRMATSGHGARLRAGLSCSTRYLYNDQGALSVHECP
eukprot:6505304-Pyramimonas_sp.AAC.1